MHSKQQKIKLNSAVIAVLHLKIKVKPSTQSKHPHLTESLIRSLAPLCNSLRNYDQATNVDRKTRS